MVPDPGTVAPAETEGLAGDRDDVGIEVRQQQPVAFEQTLVSDQVFHRGRPEPARIVRHLRVPREVPNRAAVHDVVCPCASEVSDDFPAVRRQVSNLHVRRPSHGCQLPTLATR